MNVHMVAGKQFNKFESVRLVDPSDYNKVIESFQYITLSRPDIAFEDNKMS